MLLRLTLLYSEAVD